MRENNRGTVLVIEDDPDFSEYVTTTLSDHGYHTEIVMDGDEALNKAKSVRPIGITLDILLPGRTGISVYRRLRKDKATQNIPIVILSGVGTTGERLDISRFFQGRAVRPPERVLQKPVEPETLVQAVDEAIAREAA
jgi:CheY-like chemotaxis protein